MFVLMKTTIFIYLFFFEPVQFRENESLKSRETKKNKCFLVCG